MENLSPKEIDKMIEENTSLVHYVIRRYFPIYIGDEDILQRGMIGLWKAIMNFDDTKAKALSTYAVPIIRNEIRMEFRYKKKSDRLNPLSLDAPVNNLHSDDDLITLADQIGTEESGIVDTEHAEEIMNTFLSKLDEQEKIIFKLYLLGHDQTSIAYILDLSQGYISRLLRKIKSKLYDINE